MPNEASLLETLDCLLVAAGAILLIVAAVRWRRRGGGDPLRGSPIRANRMNAFVVWVCLGVYVFSLMGGLALAEAVLPKGGEARIVEAQQGIVASVVMQTLVISTCLGVGATTFRAGLSGYGFGLPARLGRNAAVGWIVGGWLATVCCTGLVVLVVQWIIRLLWAGYQPPDHGVFTTLRASETPAILRALALISAAVTAPIGEECLFRGVLQTSLRRVLPPGRSMRHRWFAIAATAAVFGILHVETPQFVPSLVLFGIVVGYLYERTGSLVIVIAVHVLFNVKSLSWYYLQAYLTGA